MSIVVKNLNYTYNPKSPYETTALKNVSLEIPSGQFVAVCGHTGSGKTTFVQHLNALISVQQGELSVENLDLTLKHKKLRREMLKKLRGQVGMVFQYPEHQLFANTVFDDVAFGPKNMGLSDQETEQRVLRAITDVGLDYQSICRQSPFELSGGEKRRVAFAGVLAMNPQILVLDEPTAGLDPLGKEEILNLVVSLNKNHGMTIVMISHDMDEVYEYTDRILVFEKGELINDSSTYKFFSEKNPEKYGLKTPQMAILNNLLQKHGIKLDGQNRTVKEMHSAILKYLGRGEEDSNAW